MNTVNQVIKRVSGRNNKGCYQELRCAVEVALELLPEWPQMKVLQTEVVRRISKKATSSSVSRALARAAADIWQYGSRESLEALFGRPLYEQPSPRSLIFTLAEYVKEEAAVTPTGKQTEL